MSDYIISSQYLVHLGDNIVLDLCFILQVNITAPKQYQYYIFS